MRALVIPFITVFVAKTLLPPPVYFALLFAFLFCHYVLAFTALKKKSIKTNKIIELATVIVVIGGLLAWLSFPMEYAFGLHWLVGEIYLRPYPSFVSQVRFSYLTLYYLLNYTTLFAFKSNAEMLFIISLALFLSISLFAIIRLKGDERNDMSEALVTDSLYLLLAGWFLLIGLDNNYLDIVLIHLMQFAVSHFPADRVLRRPYIAKNVALTGVFVLFFHPISVLYLGGLNINGHHAAFFGFLHIFQSFFTSSLNPRWVRQLFVRKYIET